MSYTDGKRAPTPTESEKVFSALTDMEREMIARRWLKDMLGAYAANEVYPLLHEEPKQ